ncbi:SEFIR domain-containing protein [Halanaerobium saccharolyticum]|uniref:SEFIR domain-containing protein n=1 Tax=Halanaerobium saccharolyticum TaxID=43595 RepID=A0A4R7YRS8_9FIRM|nr:SEFIR domain-containing protein [Halanaerobium saccharolyticum]RAK10235.1 SEFIR domain-containing protein [Halanaerobium saccharolyticum]TDW00447.1 SEFIR domain-containing protein [Halanaerobium saccharolyticum]TDX52032.1 SEFIR domain-containing protein [Halanaerobium saccharolyticum]
MNDKNNSNENPKLFISYSWSSPDHEEWVLNLAEELVAAGVNVILDKWDLKEGNDAYAFMEKMVTDPDINKVILICDKEYAEKADDRSGGVGTETQIISQEIYEEVDQNKFVGIVKERDEDGKAYLPTYYKSRIYIDLSDEEEYAKNFERLVRWIYDKPLHIKPPIGEKPYL